MAKKILMVDDDQDFAQAVTDLVATKGYTLIHAINGELGFQKAKTENPNLILLDVMMTHETEGFDISRRLHEEPSTRNIPVIVVTGIRKETGVMFKYEPDEVWLPVKAVIEKPIQPEKFLAAVEKYVK
ncbi:MAG TPA: response regulator [Candidatus Omnitrophota bacterium]|nr:response regulator [Candidatus Omnitrophota bacterium]HPN55838.1 response regulator [Candidatus Omnitrophota bacterium]